MSGSGATLIVGVVADMTVQKRAELERLDLLRRLSDAQEEVQGRIARELHDQVGQVVTGLSLGLKGLEREVEVTDRRSRSASGDAPAGDVLATIRWLQGLAGQIGRDIHRGRVRPAVHSPRRPRADGRRESIRIRLEPPLWRHGGRTIRRHGARSVPRRDGNHDLSRRPGGADQRAEARRGAIRQHRGGTACRRITAGDRG